MDVWIVEKRGFLVIVFIKDCYKFRCNYLLRYYFIDNFFYMIISIYR